MSDRDAFVRIVVIVLSAWVATAAIDEVVKQTFVRVSSALDSWTVVNDNGEGNAVFAMADSDSLCDAVLAGMAISEVYSPTCDVTKVTADLKAYYQLKINDSVLFLAAQSSIAQQLHPTAKLVPPSQTLSAYVTLSVPPVEFTHIFAMVQSYNASGLLSRDTSIMQIAVTVMVRIITSGTTFVPYINGNIVMSTLQNITVRQGHAGHRCVGAMVNFSAGEWNQCLTGCDVSHCTFFNMEPILGTSNWSCAGGVGQVVLDQNEGPESVACFAKNILLLANTTVFLIPPVTLRLKDVGWRTALSISGKTSNWSFAGPSNFDDCYSLGSSTDTRQDSYCLMFNSLHVRLLMQRLSDGFKYSFDVGVGGPASLKNLLSQGSPEARTFVGGALWTQGLNETHSPCTIEEGFLIQRQKAMCRFGAILGAIYENYTADAPLQAIAEAQARANAETCDVINTSYKYDGSPCDGIGPLPNCSTKLSVVCPGVNVPLWNSTGNEMCPERCQLDTSYKATCDAGANGTFVVGVGCAAFGPGNASETVGIWRYKAGLRTFQPSNATLLVTGSVEDQVSVLSVTIQKNVVVDIHFTRFVTGADDIVRATRASVSNSSQPMVRRYNIAAGDYITRLVVVSLTLNCTSCASGFQSACWGQVLSWSRTCLQCSQYVVDFCIVSSGIWTLTMGIAFETSNGLHMSYNSDTTTYIVPGVGGIQHTFYTVGSSSHISGVKLQQPPGVISGVVLGIVESPLASSNYLDTPQLQNLSLASKRICGTQLSRETNCFINSSWCNLLVGHFNISGVKDPTMYSADCMMRSQVARNTWSECLLQCSYVVPASQLMLSFNNYYDRVYSEVSSFHCSACNAAFVAGIGCRDLNPACWTYCIRADNTSQTWPWARCSEQLSADATWCTSAMGRESCFRVSEFCIAGDLIKNGSGFNLAQTSDCLGNVSAMGAAWLECLIACLPFPGVDNTTLAKERDIELAMVEGIIGQAHCQLCIDMFPSCAADPNPSCPKYCNNFAHYTLRDANGTSLQYPPNHWPWVTCSGQSGSCTSPAGRKLCFRTTDFCPWFDSIQNGSDFSLAQTSVCLENSTAMREAWRECLIACLPLAGVDNATLEQERDAQLAMVEGIIGQAHCQLCIDMFPSCAVAANPSCPKYCNNSVHYTLRDAKGASLQYPPNPWPWATCSGQASASGTCTGLAGRKSCFRTTDFCPWFDSIQNGSDFTLAQTSACLDNSAAMSEAWRECLITCLPFAGVDNATLEQERETQLAMVEGILGQAHCQLCIDMFPSCAVAANPSCPKYCDKTVHYTLRDTNGTNLQYAPNPWPWATCHGQASASGPCTSLNGRKSCFRTIDFCLWFDSIQNGSDFSLAQTSACLDNSSAMSEAWRECLIACLPFAGVDNATLEQERNTQFAMVEGIIVQAHCQLCIVMFSSCAVAANPNCPKYCNNFVYYTFRDANGASLQYPPNPWPWADCPGEVSASGSCTSFDGRKSCFRTIDFCPWFDLIQNGSDFSLAQTSACLDNSSAMSEAWRECLIACIPFAGVDNATLEHERDTQFAMVARIINQAHCQLCIDMFQSCAIAANPSCPKYCDNFVHNTFRDANGASLQYPTNPWPWAACPGQASPSSSCISVDGRKSCFGTMVFCVWFDSIQNGRDFNLAQTSACLDNSSAMSEAWLECLIACLPLAGVDNATLEQERDAQLAIVEGILGRAHCQLCIKTFSGCAGGLDSSCPQYCNDIVNYSLMDSGGASKPWPWSSCSSQVSPNVTWCASAMGRMSCFRVSEFCAAWDLIKNASGFTLLQTSACLDNLAAIGAAWLDCLVACLPLSGIGMDTLEQERNYEFDVVKGIVGKAHCQLCINAFSGCSAIVDPRCMNYCNDSVNHSLVDNKGITRHYPPTRWPWWNCSGQVSAMTSTSTTMSLTLSHAKGVSLMVKLKCATAAASSCNVSKSDLLGLVAEVFGQPESDIDLKIVYRVSVKYSLKAIGMTKMDSEKVRKVLKTVYPDIEANEPLGILVGDSRRLQTSTTSADTSVDMNISTLYRDLFDQLRLQPLDQLVNPVAVAFLSLTNVTAALAELPQAFVDFVVQVLPRGNSAASDSYISFQADPNPISAVILDQLRLRYPELQSVDAAFVDIGSFWEVDNWSNCTSKCGSGRQWRPVFCKARNDQGIKMDSPAVDCLRDFPSPEETRTCYATCSLFESYASTSDEVKASSGVVIIAVVVSILGCCCFAVAYCLQRKCKQPRRGVVRSNKDMTGVESVEWELVTRPHEKAHVVWKLDEGTIAMFQVDTFVLNTDEPREVDDHGQDHITIGVETSCQDAVVYPPLFPAYQTGDVVEYFSISNRVWTGGEILIDLTSQPGEVLYNVVICQGRQIRSNVPLHLVRKPMQPGEPCSYFSVQRGRWYDGFVSCCEQAVRPLLSGYMVDLGDSLISGQGSKSFPATRIRRRYPLGTPVEVYIDATKGWRPAIILECNEDVSEQPELATSRVNLRAIHDEQRLPTDNYGKAVRMWLKARVELKENGDTLERWTWLVRSVGDGWW